MANANYSRANFLSNANLKKKQQFLKSKAWLFQENSGFSCLNFLTGISGISHFDLFFLNSIIPIGKVDEKMGATEQKGDMLMYFLVAVPRQVMPYNGRAP